MQERTCGDLVAGLERQRDAILAAMASFDESGKPVRLDQSAQGRVRRIDAITQQQMARAGRTHPGIQLKRIAKPAPCPAVSASPSPQEPH